MNKRYQVFVSSTYADLKDERAKVIQTIMELDCIPAGMELFPAIDDEQFEFIKKVIDDCDYYILIIGGRYGSLSSDGISYTEKEYDYATDKGIKVIAFIHSNPDAIPLGKSEKDNNLREKLEEFKKKVSTGRLIKFWNNAEDLPGLVALSLSKTIKTYPAVGWVRANSVVNPEVYQELNTVRKENAELKESISNTKTAEIDHSNLASLNDKYTFNGKYKRYSGQGGYYYHDNWSVSVSWGGLFALFSPYLLQHPSDKDFKSTISEIFYDLYENESKKSGGTPYIDDQDFQTIKVHYSTLGLINVKYSKTTGNGMNLFWNITENGIALMNNLRSVKKQL